MRPLTALEYSTMDSRLEVAGSSWLIEIRSGELVEAVL